MDHIKKAGEMARRKELLNEKAREVLCTYISEERYDLYLEMVEKPKLGRWRLKVDSLELVALYPEFGNVEELFI